MRELAAVLDELAAEAPVDALSWRDVEARSDALKFRSRRGRRRSLVRAIVAAGVLAIAGTAVGVGVTLLDQQEVFHDAAPDDPERLGPLVEITSGENWSLIAWQSNFGLCLDFAIPGNSPFACDFPVRGAKPAADTSGSDPPVHMIAGQVSGGGLVGGDGKTTIFGVAAADVAAVNVELSDGRVVGAPLYDAPPELQTTVRVFIVRLPLSPEQRDPDSPGTIYGPGGEVLRSQSPVRAFIAYDRTGDVYERVEH